MSRQQPGAFSKAPAITPLLCARPIAGTTADSFWACGHTVLNFHGVRCIAWTMVSGSKALGYKEWRSRRTVSIQGGLICTEARTLRRITQWYYPMKERASSMLPTKRLWKFTLSAPRKQIFQLTIHLQLSTVEHATGCAHRNDVAAARCLRERTKLFLIALLVAASK